MYASVNDTIQHQARIDLPETVNSSGAKLVYLYLFIEDTATIDELCAALNMKKLTLYSLLETLTATNLVDREGERYLCRQAADGGNP